MTAPDLPPVQPMGPMPGTGSGSRTGRPDYAPAGRIAYLEARVAHLETQLAEERRQARTDPLTGVLNRAGLVDAWWRIRPGDRLALVDLDGFKAVNDTLGHAAGDAVLTTVAQQLRVHGIVARLGGDELVVIGSLPGGPDRLWRAPVGGGREVTVTGTVGITPVIPGDLPETLRRADVAMYAAKHAGRGSLVAYDPTLDVPEQTGPARRRVRDLTVPARRLTVIALGRGAA
ncbi:GGDEF domain-containing protein [Micromonospora sp. NPDC002296]|uniref:GGDEF domain-containing protein n=1 Tax=Micromonospora sp. NPDC002296 TaxID=3154271 RepID=UPI00331A5DE7